MDVNLDIARYHDRTLMLAQERVLPASGGGRTGPCAHPRANDTCRVKLPVRVGATSEVSFWLVAVKDATEEPAASGSGTMLTLFVFVTAQWMEPSARRRDAGVSADQVGVRETPETEGCVSRSAEGRPVAGWAVAVALLC